MKAKKPDMPPVPPPPAVPELGPEAGDEMAKAIRRRSGYRRTILTGALAPGDQGKKTLLGG